MPRKGSFLPSCSCGRARTYPLSCRRCLREDECWRSRSPTCSLNTFVSLPGSEREREAASSGNVHSDRVYLFPPPDWNWAGPLSLFLPNHSEPSLVGHSGGRGQHHASILSLPCAPHRCCDSAVAVIEMERGDRAHEGQSRDFVFPRRILLCAMRARCDAFLSQPFPSLLPPLHIDEGGRERGAALDEKRPRPNERRRSLPSSSEKAAACCSFPPSFPASFVGRSLASIVRCCLAPSLIPSSIHLSSSPPSLPSPFLPILCGLWRECATYVRVPSLRCTGKRKEGEGEEEETV